jgi:NAD(P)-dependent dehydrogenase (short-subunit alcohol dehydrogenase family)
MRRSSTWQPSSSPDPATGSDATRRLIDAGHAVVGHARNRDKAGGPRRELPGIADVLSADLSSATQVADLAASANALGTFDAVI